MYRAGERLLCTVVSKELDSYRVAVADEGLPGVLRINEALEIGARLEVCFVCMQGDLVVVKQIDTAALRNVSERLSQKSLELTEVLSSEAEATLANKLLQMSVNCGFIDAQTAREVGAGIDGALKLESIMVLLKQSNGYTEKQLDELREVLGLVQAGTIKFEQVAVAHYDFVTAGVPLRESLTVRGWL